ncbi:MAG: cyanoexosortase A system-associated protein [Geitlerinemataceae cyanobacterium]
MISWKQTRLPLLAFNLLTAGFVLGKALLDPRMGQLTPFEFSPDVPLTQWQPVESERLKPLPEPDTDGSILQVGRTYQYRQNDRLLDIEMRYVLRTQGEVENFVKDRRSQEDKKENKQPDRNEKIDATVGYEPEVGSYVLLADKERAYLSACINPRGESTFSREQYKHNQDIYDTEFSRLIPSFLGREKWRDDRCLWTYMSMPLEGSNPKETYKLLESAWFEWNEWWQPQFPKL